MKKEIKAIIFDAGRVLVNFDNEPFWNGLAPFSTYSAEEIKDRLKGSGIIKDYHDGKISTQDFYEKSIKEIDSHDLDFETFKKLWRNIITTQNKEIEKVLGLIREEIKLLILSDTSIIHWDVIKNFELIKTFFPSKKQATLSFEVNVSKPDEKIYQEAVRRADCLFGECIFIDDNEVNVEQFKIMGGNAIKYDCRTNTIQELIEEMSMYNVFK